MLDELPWPLLAAILACAALVVLWWRARTRIRRGNLARQRAAQRGEHRAEQLLQELGFHILERQVTGRWTFWIDGAPAEVTCRADLIVQAGRGAAFPRGHRFVAEVKTGDLAPDPRRPATRRQLLEYQRAFDVEGLLLVDMEQRRVRHVEF